MSCQRNESADSGPDALNTFLVGQPHAATKTGAINKLTDPLMSIRMHGVDDEANSLAKAINENRELVQG